MSESEQNMIMEMMNRLNNCTSESYLKIMQSDMNMHCMMNHMMSMMMRMPHKSMMCNMIECMNSMIMMSTRSNMMSSSSMMGSSTNTSGMMMMMKSFSMNMNNDGNSMKFSPFKSESMNGEMFCKMMRMMTSHNIRMIHESMNIMMNMYCCPSTMKMMMNGECHSSMSMMEMLSCMMMMETVSCDIGSEHTHDLIHSSCFSMMCSFMKNNENLMKCLMESCFDVSSCTASSSLGENCEKSAERMMLINMCCMMEQVDEKHIMNMCKKICEMKNSMMNPMEFMD
jgi:hypothetical protein